MAKFTVDKQCRRCQLVKPLDQFYKAPTMRDGRSGQCKECAKLVERIRYSRTPYDQTRHNERRRAPQFVLLRKVQRRNIRNQFLDAYGPVCGCCGERERRFLTLDHIHGGGNKHSRERGSLGVYKDALAESAPNNKYQVLCYNCNLGRAHNGGVCPHEVARREAAQEAA